MENKRERDNHTAVADPTSDLTSRLHACYTGAVYDVLREAGLTDTILSPQIEPLDKTLKLSGPVFTVRGSPKPNVDSHQTLIAWTEFLSKAPAGHVVVMEGRDENRALMGELSAETLQYRGVRGYVTDGGCRDCSFIRRIGFPVFSALRTPRDVVGAWTPDAFCEPITIGGVRIRMGDYVIGDIDGVVIIPGSKVVDIVEEVERVMATENRVRSAILKGTDPKTAYLTHGKF